MNKTQREIIAIAYKEWLVNNKNCDPVGGFMDVKDMFSQLSETDPKLAKELQETYNEVFEE